MRNTICALGSIFLQRCVNLTFIDRDIIGLDDQSHLVYFMASADLDEGLPLSKSLLNRQVHSNEVAHVLLLW